MLEQSTADSDIFGHPRPSRIDLSFVEAWRLPQLMLLRFEEPEAGELLDEAPLALPGLVHWYQKALEA